MSNCQAIINIILQIFIIKMINHHTILKQELKRIGNNINKKYATLRKQVIKTSQVFDNQRVPVFPYQVCFGLFRQIAETGSLTSSMVFLPFLQNVINLGFSNAEMSREILTLLTHTKCIPKFACLENETKMQQILAILVSKNCIDLNNLAFTHSLFNIVLSLDNTKYKQIWLKSSTILHQTLLLLVNDFKDNPTEQKGQSLNKFISNLIKIIIGEQPTWLIQFADPYLILQIMSEALEDKFFIDNTEIRYKQQFSELLVHVRRQIRKCAQNGYSFMSNSKLDTGNSSQSNQKTWQLSNQNKLLILFRVGCKINILGKIGFDILEQAIKIISDKRCSVYKAIAYEGLNYLFRNSSWMLKLFESEFIDLFNFLLTTEFNTIKYLFSEQKEKIDLVNYFTGQQTNFTKIMGTNNIDVNIVEFNYSHEVKMIVKSLEEVTYALYAIYSQRFKIDMNQKIEGKPPLQKCYKFCHKTVFQTIKTILSKDMSEDTLQSLLKISQKFINLSGCFNDSSVSAIYIKLMCKYCLPTQFKNIDHRHIQINKMILNTANCLGHLFTSSCWVIVWKTLQNYSTYYNRYLLSKQQLQSARESDVQILYKSMDSIFTQSPKYNDIYLLEVIRSLVEVAYECLENNYNDETRKIFAFQRIQQIYKLNLFRVCIIWPELSSSLLCITTSKVLYFRLSALALLNNLIPQSLNYLKGHPEALKGPFTQQNYQQILLEPWINLVNCQFQEIKEEFIIAVNKLIIDYGHIMTHGWRCIMEIVKKTNDLKSLQAIVETFLQKVHDYIMDVIVIVDAIERKLSETNQKYLCLTMIWSIADYARKNEQLDALKKIYQILLVPEEMFNLSTQARHSSFYIFAEIVVHNCTEKSPQFWEWIFEEIKRFYTYGIGQCMNPKNKNFGEEALKNLITNLIKVYKKFFLVAKQWEQKDISAKLLGDFYNFCGKVLQYRSPQIYQSLIKQTKQLLPSKIKQSLSIKQYYSFLQNLTQIYYVENDPKVLKCLITYLPGDIYDILSMSLQGLEKNFVVMYRLVEKIYLLKLQANQKDIKLQQLRIFFEEKYHYQFMRKMQSFVNEQKESLIPIYMQNVCKTIHKLRLYEDYNSISKTLPFVTNSHLKFPQILSNMVLQTYKQVIKIRNDESWIKNMANAKDIPIWYICSQDLMKICYEYIQKQSESRKVAYNIIRQLLNEDISSQVLKYTKQIKIYYYQNELEMCHFLFENYYLSSRQVLGQQSIMVRQIGLIIEKRSSQFEQNEDVTRKAFNAYQLLFKICHDRGENGYQHSKIEENQSIIIGILFQRVLKTFDKVKISSNKQIKSVISSLVLDELRFVLKHLKALKLKQNVLKKIQFILCRAYVSSININALVLQLSEAQLFFFQPLIAKCIRCEDPQTLEQVQAIFQRTSQILLKLDVSEKNEKKVNNDT